MAKKRKGSRAKQATARRESASPAAPAAPVSAAPPAAPVSAVPPAPTALAPAVEEVVEPPPEHRASPRISLAIELHLASESHFFSGLSGDISEGGVFVSTYRALAIGSLVDLEFSLPGADRPVLVRGQVRWHRDASPYGPPGVGIAFEALSEHDRGTIHGFCTMRPPLYYDDVG